MVVPVLDFQGRTGIPHVCLGPVEGEEVEYCRLVYRECCLMWTH